MVTYRKDEAQRPEGWNTGAPPHVGWWVVKALFGEPGTFKAWWDGQMWSAQTCEVDEVPEFAITQLAQYKAGAHGSWLNWCWLWPKNARVARVNPETGEVTGSGPCPYETDGKAWPFGDVKKKSEDAPKLKKKPAGNRKVTRYVVMAQHKITMAASCDGSFESKKNAESRMEQTLKICGDTHRMWIQKIRFRTPEL